MRVDGVQVARAWFAGERLSFGSKVSECYGDCGGRILGCGGAGSYVVGDAESRDGVSKPRSIEPDPRQFADDLEHEGWVDGPSQGDEGEPVPDDRFVGVALLDDEICCHVQVRFQVSDAKSGDYVFRRDTVEEEPDHV